MGDAWDATKSVVSGAVQLAAAPFVIPATAAVNVAQGKNILNTLGSTALGAGSISSGFGTAANFYKGGMGLTNALGGGKIVNAVDKLTLGGVKDLNDAANLQFKAGTSQELTRADVINGGRGSLWTGVRVGAAYGASLGAAALGATGTAVVGNSALALAKGKDPISVLTNAFAPAAAPYVQDYKDIIAPYAPVIDAASQFFPTSNPNAPQSTPSSQGQTYFDSGPAGISGDLRDVFLNDNTGKYLMYAALGLGALYLYKRAK